MSKFTPGQRARAQRHDAGRRARVAEALAVAQQHPGVGQQVVRQVDGLGALEVGVAGHRPVQVALGGAGQRARQRPRSPPAPAAAASRVNIATSVATWSLRERAVCRRPPTGPASSVSRRSTAMWMSSSSSRNGKLPSASSRSTASRPASRASRSASPMMPRAASIRACARDWATSNGHSRRSKDSDVFSARNAGSCGSEKRDMGRGSLTGVDPELGDLLDLRGQREAEQVQAQAPAVPGARPAAHEPALGVAQRLDGDRDEAGQPEGHEDPGRPPHDEVARLEAEGGRDRRDRVVPEQRGQRGGASTSAPADAQGAPAARALALEPRHDAWRASSSASATRAIWLSASPGKNGSATDRAATSSQTGNSPGRWPNASR